MSTYKKRTKCASCDNTQLDSILKYGEVPLAGYFPSKDEIDNEELFDLNVLFCSKCYLVQTDSIIDSDKLFRDYRYMSSIGLSGHFGGVASMLKLRFGLYENSNVVEIGSNDGVLQEPFLTRGVEVVGFEPAVNISKIARDKGCTVINDYFNEETARRHLRPSSTDLIISNNCFAHIDDIKSVIRGIQYALRPNAYFVFEVSYLKDLVDKIQYDNIYHEHIYYYSLSALDKLFKQFNMVIDDFEFIPIHSGSIRVYVRNGKFRVQPLKVKDYLAEEARLGLTSLEWFSGFSKRVTDHVVMVDQKIKDLKASGATIAGYGASGRANMLCNIADLGPYEIDYIVDESPERAGRFIAGRQIPIVGPEMLEIKQPDYIVLFAWNFADKIKAKLAGKGYKFITFFPEYQVS
jgi:SAM-dependent methyltransferase